MKKTLLDQVRKLSAEDQTAHPEQKPAKAPTALLQAIQTARGISDEFETYLYAATPEQAQRAIANDRPNGMLRNSKVVDVPVTFPGESRFAMTMVRFCFEGPSETPIWQPQHLLDVPPDEILCNGGCGCELRYDANEPWLVGREEMLRTIAEHNAEVLEHGENWSYWAVLIEVGLPTEHYWTDVVLTGDAGRMKKVQDLPVRVVRPTAEEVEELRKAIERETVRADS